MTDQDVEDGSCSVESGHDTKESPMDAELPGAQEADEPQEAPEADDLQEAQIVDDLREALETEPVDSTLVDTLRQQLALIADLKLAEEETADFVEELEDATLTVSELDSLRNEAKEKQQESDGSGQAEYQQLQRELMGARVARRAAAKKLRDHQRTVSTVVDTRVTVT